MLNIQSIFTCVPMWDALSSDFGTGARIVSVAV